MSDPAEKRTPAAAKGEPRMRVRYSYLPQQFADIDEYHVPARQ